MKSQPASLLSFLFKKKPKRFIICDLDGTIADIEERRALAKHTEGRFDWKKFFTPELIKLDKPNYPVIDVLQTYNKKKDVEIWIFSGRDDITRTATIEWLAQHNVPYQKLLMRPNKDHTPDDTLKRKWLYQHFKTENEKDRILFILDDRDKVVRMWRKEGLTCFQVDYGDF